MFCSLFAFRDVIFVIVLYNVMNNRNQDSFKRVLERDFAGFPRRFRFCWFTWSPLSRFGHQNMFFGEEKKSFSAVVLLQPAHVFLANRLKLASAFPELGHVLSLEERHIEIQCSAT